MGYADSPEGACEKARMQAKNPPGPSNMLIVIASDDQWTHIVYNVSKIIQSTPEPDIRQIQQCPIAERYFVDYL
jgi:hypothetical protein